MDAELLKSPNWVAEKHKKKRKKDVNVLKVRLL